METAINIGYYISINTNLKHFPFPHTNSLLNFVARRFACSLLRQGMKQICISTMNTDLLSNDAKKVERWFCYTSTSEGFGIYFFIHGKLIS